VDFEVKCGARRSVIEQARARSTRRTFPGLDSINKHQNAQISLIGDLESIISNFCLMQPANHSVVEKTSHCTEEYTIHSIVSMKELITLVMKHLTYADRTRMRAVSKRYRALFEQYQGVIHSLFPYFYFLIKFSVPWSQCSRVGAVVVDLQVQADLVPGWCGDTHEIPRLTCSVQARTTAQLSRKHALIHIRYAVGSIYLLINLFIFIRCFFIFFIYFDIFFFTSLLLSVLHYYSCSLLDVHQRPARTL
jgi:hypothetical protein